MLSFAFEHLNGVFPGLNEISTEFKEIFIKIVILMRWKLCKIIIWFKHKSFIDFSDVLI